MNAIIITAKGQSQSIPHKNVAPVLGHPCVSYALNAAVSSDLTDIVFCSTDCNVIAAISEAYGAQIIWRPDEYCTPEANHGDAIQYSVREALKANPTIENVVILIGNGVMIDGALIDQALGLLIDDPDIDSVMTVWEAQDDHPLRSLSIDESGLLTEYPGRHHLEGAGPDMSTNRQSYPSAYYFDQGLWAFRTACVEEKTGPMPWWWMGRRCKPIVRRWLAGRDIHHALDISAAEWWLEEGHKHASR